MDLRTWWIQWQIPYERLSLFSGNLATCLEAGLALSASLEHSRRALHGTGLADSMQDVADRVQRGESLTAAMTSSCHGLPPFFIPVIEAGEVTGQVDDSLRFLETHCRLLARPAAAMRNIWLMPLAVIVAGTVLRFLAILCWGSWGGTLAFIWGSLTSYPALGALLFIVFGTPFRPLIDFLKLHLPFVGPLERDLNANRFFHALAMLHAVAGHRVEQMVRIATRTVNNQLLQSDLEEVAAKIERGSTITEAFDDASYLTPAQKQMIATGELSGTLERSYHHIAEEAASTLQVRLEIIRFWAVRIAYCIALYSIVRTLFVLVLPSRF